MIARLPRRVPADRSPRAGVLLLLLAASLTAACDKVPLFAPSGSTIILNATNLVVPSNGVIEIIAQVIEPAGTPVHNGTVITFTTTVGTLEPGSEVRTNGGKATIRLHGSGQSGAAIVTAFSGDARAELELLVGGAAAGAISLTAAPRTVQPGGTTEISAHVTDTGGNPLASIPVSFTTDAGTLSASSATTDAAGTARVQLTTDRDATVTARVSGSTVEEATISIDIAAPIAITLAAAPNPVTVNNPTVLTATTTATGILRFEWDFTSNGVVDMTTTGNVVSHVYTSSGLKTARVRAVGSAGSEGVASTIINVISPVVTISATPASPLVGQTVSFTATVAPPDTIVQRYDWVFGDGETRSTTGNTVSHVYTAAGTRNVTVAALTADGTSLTGLLTIVVQPSP